MDMDNEHTFVTIDNDVNEVLLIDVNETTVSDFVMVDEVLDDTDFITLSDDVEIASYEDIIDITSGMDDADVSIIV
ncbi:hypothetical protein TFKS16_2698 [Tannerella forsythia KS16]|jgi:hypothetical protein|uniref:Uncharacterized protein n=2 Tax=Tannerella forsythia TaxID=28112 RepID=G8UPQ7_TANFA|nr:hypothetical protein [Tannerella forsythia]AEW20707.1 hypothetical protein BFO_2978 [Tannerella forsythia 92A2]KKY60432.1 hypothetical protein Tanf_12950 [Tannerella forsythia]OLQ21305.1 hypothetical protein BGK60_11505 [Tannerella forsythia]PDP43242.1 hypothetical protein CLI86_09410 [Tannerella forsythia]PDP70765.1 hypothetical protein CLI85_07875 [Tannerella forsythia]